MGMGGGYYDRAFEFVGQPGTFNKDRPARPILIGVAHECQNVEKIPTGHWGYSANRHSDRFSSLSIRAICFANECELAAPAQYFLAFYL